MRRKRAESRAAYDAGQESGPGLARRNARRQLWPADQTPAEIGADVRAPDHGEQPADRASAEKGVVAQHKRREQQAAGVKQAEARPDQAALPRGPSREGRRQRRQEEGQFVLAQTIKDGRGAQRQSADEKAQPGQWRADQTLPFPVDGERGYQPESREQPAAGRQRADRGNDQEGGRGGPEPKVLEMMTRHKTRLGLSSRLNRRRVALSHTGAAAGS